MCAGGPEEADRTGDVHERLVQADRLDHGGDVGQDLVQRPADLGVAAVAPGEKDGLAGRAGGPAPTAWPNGRRSARASYVHEATTPRAPAPPTITGLPARDGSSSTSTDAKNASMSMCRMVGRVRPLSHRASTGGTPRRRRRRPACPPRPPAGAQLRRPIHPARRTASGDTRRQTPSSRWCPRCPPSRWARGSPKGGQSRPGGPDRRPGK